MVGVAFGLQCVAIPRYVEEYVPPHLFSTLAPLFTVAQAVGNLLAVLGGLLLPPDDASEEELLSVTLWRYLFAFPVIPLLFVLIHLLVNITGESPKFLLMQGKDKEFHDAVCKIYEMPGLYGEENHEK